MKILAIGDTANNFESLQKFSKNLDIHLITFPRKQAELFTLSEKVEKFDSLLISQPSMLVTCLLEVKAGNLSIVSRPVHCSAFITMSSRTN